MISLSDSAVEYFKQLLQQQHSAVGIRLGIVKSGCSGLSYSIDFAMSQQNNDVITRHKEVAIVIAQENLVYLQDLTIDYAVDGLNSHIKFINPNAINECGCGESFQLRDDAAN